MERVIQFHLDKYNLKWTCLLILFIAISSPTVSAQPSQAVSYSENEYVKLKAPDGTIITLVAQDDVDADGISNDLEVNGYFWDPDSFRMRPCDEDESKECFITDPLQASTDQDPYIYQLNRIFPRNWWRGNCWCTI